MAMAPLSPVGRLSSQQQPSLLAPSQGLIQQQNQSLGTSLPPQASGNYRSSVELRSLDCNLAALCDHIQVEGFNSGIFSDVVVQAMGATYRLHRLILSRSSYFRNMLHGPWKEAGLPTLVLYIDDANVNSEAIEVALAYLYGHQPKLNDNNAFRVLAAASFLDLQDLCAVCTDFIISELWTSNFLSYQVFAESQDYGIHGERVRNACWGYLCQSATTELREVLPKLSPQILHSLLTSDELWVPSEEKRFELALHALLVKASMSELEHAGEESFSSDKISTSDTPRVRGESSIDAKSGKQQVETELCNLSVEDNFDRSKAVPDAFLEHSDHVAGPDRDLFYLNSLQSATTHQVQDARYSLNRAQAVSSNSLVNTNAITASCSYIELQNDVETRLRRNEVAAEGPSGESHCHQLNNRIWLSQDQPKMSSVSLSTNNAIPSDWGRCNMPSWGGRIVGRGHVKGAKSDSIIHDEHYDAFVNIFEGGSLLYCNMSFEALLNVRRQLEELDFPCKAVNDGLWLQMLLCHRVQAIVADSCKNCCLRNNACQCGQTFRYSHGNIPAAYYRQEHDRNSTNTMGGIYIADAQGDGSGLFGPVRVHVRGAIDGLVSIDRGTTYVPGDGLTALVGLSQGNNVVDVHTEEVETVYGTSPQHRFPGVHLDASDISVQMLEVQENSSANEWENSEGSSISLDLQTPLRQFPPFRFGVEFKHVDKLTDGQVRHSTEVFYAGSLWKVSVQAFNDEDPQGRRTLGLFLHRRKAEVTDSSRKLHMYVDSREKVTARYQLICPSKREVLVFGSFKQAGTLLPKAPKGWGWRTALLFDELADLLQVGALRVTAVVQLV